MKDQGEDTKPLWNYVSKIKGLSGGCGNFEVRCNFCEIVFNGSYTRVRTHLLKITKKGVRSCQKITPSNPTELTKMDNEAALRIERSKKKSFSLPPMPNQETTNVDPKKRKTLECSFNMQARETFDYEIARIFYSSRLLFHLARNPHYRKAFSVAANNNCISGYQLPDSNKLKTTLLENERRHVENLLQPIKKIHRKKKCVAL